MSLAKERILEGSQTRPLYGNVHGGGRSIQGLDPSSVHVSSYKGHNSVVLEDGEGSESLESYSRGIVPLLSDPSNSPSGSFVFGPVVDSSRQVEAHSVVNFKAASDHWAYSGSSVLSFEQGDAAICTNYQNIDQEDESGIWMDAMDQNYQLNNHRMSNAIDDNRHGKEKFGLLNLGVAAGDDLQESVEQENGIQKRPYTGGDMQASKKHCGNSRKTEAKPGPSKDPQSIAAKVDLVTMLEKAISYVKFLQLQVKVLATDEFWPAQGGKAPDVSQVKEAIDAILSSHRNRNSSSK